MLCSRLCWLIVYALLGMTSEGRPRVMPQVSACVPPASAWAKPRYVPGGSRTDGLVTLSRAITLPQQAPMVANSGYAHEYPWDLHWAL